MSWWLLSSIGLMIDAIGAIILTYDLNADYNLKRAHEAWHRAKRLLVEPIFVALNAEAPAGQRLPGPAPFNLEIEQFGEERLVALLTRAGISDRQYEAIDQALGRVHFEYNWPWAMWGRPRDPGLTDFQWIARRFINWAPTFQLNADIGPAFRFRPALRWGGGLLILGFVIQLVSTIGTGLAAAGTQ